MITQQNVGDKLLQMDILLARAKHYEPELWFVRWPAQVRVAPLEFVYQLLSYAAQLNKLVATRPLEDPCHRSIYCIAGR